MSLIGFPDGIFYLVNCSFGASEVAFYDDWRKSQATDREHFNRPNQIGQVTNESFIIWEGQKVKPNGFVFDMTVMADHNAHDNAFGTKVGEAFILLFGSVPAGSPRGSQSYMVLDIFRDSERVLYLDEGKGECKSIYWCAPVSFNAQFSCRNSPLTEPDLDG
jgi:hypothetical protein